jgi:glyoxylase-like metal-dependent hydrolase (beta-lactamase superfamily II)
VAEGVDVLQSSDALIETRNDATHIELFHTEGLGDNSYLVWRGRQAVLVDPQRDVERFLSAARARGSEVVKVLDTHVHNDYVSGANEIRSATGAEVVGPASAGTASRMWGWPRATKSSWTASASL